MARTGDALVDDVTGAPIVLSNECGMVDDELHIPYVADSFEYANDDEMAVSVVLVANEGGYEAVFDDAVLKERFGWVDTDVGLNVTPAIQAAVAAELADRILTRAALTVRPVVCTLDSGNGPAVLDTIIRLEVDHKVHVQQPGVRFSNARVCEVAHAVTPNGSGVRWTADVGFDVTVDYSWEAVA